MAILSLIADAAAVLAASSFSRSDSTAYNRAISEEDSPARGQAGARQTNDQPSGYRGTSLIIKRPPLRNPLGPPIGP